MSFKLLSLVFFLFSFLRAQEVFYTEKEPNIFCCPYFFVPESNENLSLRKQIRKILITSKEKKKWKNIKNIPVAYDLSADFSREKPQYFLKITSIHSETKKVLWFGEIPEKRVYKLLKTWRIFKDYRGDYFFSPVYKNKIPFCGGFVSQNKEKFCERLTQDYSEFRSVSKKIKLMFPLQYDENLFPVNAQKLLAQNQSLRKTAEHLISEMEKSKLKIYFNGTKLKKQEQTDLLNKYKEKLYALTLTGILKKENSEVIFLPQTLELLFYDTSIDDKVSLGNTDFEKIRKQTKIFKDLDTFYFFAIEINDGFPMKITESLRLTRLLFQGNWEKLPSHYEQFR